VIVVLKYQRNVPRRMGGGLAGGAHARATDGVVNRCRPSRWSWGCPSTRARGKLGKLPSASRTALVEEVAQPDDPHVRVEPLIRALMAVRDVVDPVADVERNMPAHEYQEAGATLQDEVSLAVARAEARAAPEHARASLSVRMQRAVPRSDRRRPGSPSGAGPRRNRHGGAASKAHWPMRPTPTARS